MNAAAPAIPFAMKIAIWSRVDGAPGQYVVGVQPDVMSWCSIVSIFL